MQTNTPKQIGRPGDSAAGGGRKRSTSKLLFRKQQPDALLNLLPAFAFQAERPDSNLSAGVHFD